MTQRPPSDSEITMTDLPVVRTSSGETTLTMAWRAPKDSILRINGTPTSKPEWVRVTNSVGNGPYQVTVTGLTAGERWSARLRIVAHETSVKWRHKVWWPFVDFLEDAWEWLKHN